MASANLTEFELSLARAHVPAHFGWSIFGLIGGISNFLIIITVVKSKELHTKSQFLLASMALADSAYGWSFFGTGIHRYLDYIKGDPGSPFACALRSFPFIFFASTSNGFKLALSIDRLFAVGHPIFYRTRKTTQYICLFNAAIWINGISETSISFVSYNPTLAYSICTLQSLYSKFYASFTGVVSMAKVVATIIIYSIAITVLMRRMLATKNLDNFQRSAERSKLELNTFKTLLVIGVTYLVSTTVGFGVYLILPLVSKELAVIAMPYSGLLNAFDCMSNLFILALMSPTFRKALKSLFLKKKETNQLSIGLSKIATQSYPLSVSGGLGNTRVYPSSIVNVA